MTPRISVLMPVRNGLPWLREALEGLAAQTMPDFEILALEDGSTDGTADLLSSWSDDRLRVIPTGGVGVAAALSLGLDQARAPIVARQDADDVSMPERFEMQARFLDAHAEVGLVATVADYVDGSGSPIENEWVRTIRRQQDVALTPGQIRDLLPLTCCITHGSVMARAATLRAAGGYRQATAPAEDYDLWLRLLAHTSIAKLPERLYRYRVHDAQVSGRSAQAQLAQAVAAKLRHVRRHCPDLPSPARLVVLGDGRGAACYRLLASAHEFDLVPPPPALMRDNLVKVQNPIVRRWMLNSFAALVVADFADLDAYADALAAGIDHGEALRVGNVFVPRRWVASQAA